MADDNKNTFMEKVKDVVRKNQRNINVAQYLVGATTFLIPVS
jgi:hypothetical protein